MEARRAADMLVVLSPLSSRMDFETSLPTTDLGCMQTRVINPTAFSLLVPAPQ